MAIVYLSLGSNKGDRIGYVQQATSLLSATDGINIIRTSAFYETEPWNMVSNTWFVNAVIEIKTSLSPEALLTECQRIEKQLGREREREDAYDDRTIDIDILLYNKEIINGTNIYKQYPNGLPIAAVGSIANQKEVVFILFIIDILLKIMT